MIKVIKMGKVNQEHTHYQTCPYCECEYSYDDCDIINNTVNYNYIMKYVTCPCCGAMNYINDYGYLYNVFFNQRYEGDDSDRQV